MYVGGRNMFRVLIAGSGKIGSLIACLLKNSGRYEVHIGDVSFHSADVSHLLRVYPEIKKMVLDFSDEDAVGEYVQENGIQAVISSLPYFLNPKVAEMAKKNQIHYFDLTEDTHVTACVKALAKDAKNAFVPQCGLAPGFINLTANSMMKTFDRLDSAKLRVGALPQNSNHALHYALTWSTDGIINEYGNLCHAIERGESVMIPALEACENIQLNGRLYEAFHTSGGVGHLVEMYQGKINTLNYKTMRYPGHCEKMRFLMNDLKLNEDRPTLKRILENSVPKTYQDLVAIYISVTGWKGNDYLEQNYCKKIYPKEIGGILWSAIQVSTASSICTIADIILSDKDHYSGFVLQEVISLETFLANPFSQPYQEAVHV
jgi:saccharopine dehydrogenase-like NADP-dependent oxidoreductase